MNHIPLKRNALSSLKSYFLRCGNSWWLAAELIDDNPYDKWTWSVRLFYSTKWPLVVRWQMAVLVWLSSSSNRQFPPANKWETIINRPIQWICSMLTNRVQNHGSRLYPLKLKCMVADQERWVASKRPGYELSKKLISGIYQKPPTRNALWQIEIRVKAWRRRLQKRDLFIIKGFVEIMLWGHEQFKLTNLASTEDACRHDIKHFGVLRFHRRNVTHIRGIN